VERVVPQAEGPEVIEVPEIEFVDAGGNWSGVQCPHCLADLEAFENGQWWQNRMTESYEGTHFADRRSTCRAAARRRTSPTSRAISYRITCTTRHRTRSAVRG
jgi:hypothetical protein